MTSSPAPWSAVILAGGRAARLDGADKSAIEIEGRTLLARTVDAALDAAEVVVVGDPVPTERPVTFVREEPRFGGPAAGLLAGVDALLRPAAYVAVLAVDMPWLQPRTLRRLSAAALAADGSDGAVLVGPDGRRQLVLFLDAAGLAAVRPAPEAAHGLSMWRLLAPLQLTEVAAHGAEYRDIDTWADLREQRH